jgi:hypothetical protein
MLIGLVVMRIDFDFDLLCLINEWGGLVFCWFLADWFGENWLQS